MHYHCISISYMMYTFSPITQIIRIEVDFMKRTFSLILCTILILSSALLGSCGKDETVLKVATNAEFEPWESLDENQKVVGADADIIKLVADQLGKTVKFMNMEFDGVVAAVKGGKCDVAISGLTINATRKESVDFSIPYYETSQILIVGASDTVFTGTTKAALDAQLKGKKVGVCSGYTGAFYAAGDEEWGFPGVEASGINTYDNISLAIADLKSNKIDVIIMDDTVAKNAVANETAVKLIDVALTTESYGIALPKGNTELKEKIDAALTKLINDGKLKDIFDQWEINYVK